MTSAIRIQHRTAMAETEVTLQCYAVEDITSVKQGFSNKIFMSCFSWLRSTYSNSNIKLIEES